MNHYTVLLVNPMASSKYLSDELRNYAIKSTALYTLDVSGLSSYLQINPDLFNEQIFIVSTNIEDIVTHLGERKFDFVLNCFEGSVEVSENLAKVYTPNYANNPNSFMRRYDKYEMHKALANHNLSHIKQVLYSRNDALPDLSSLGLAYPCFVKPLAANGSIGAYKINNKSQLEKYFNIDCMSFKNVCETEENKDKFLIAEFVEGTELTVDTFSVKGKHYISSVQRYQKKYFKSGPLYCYFEVITDQKLIQKVSNYIFQVLNATELFNGFAHNEIFLMADGDLKLIEINPRIAGAAGMTNKIGKLSGNPTQIDLFVKHIFNIEAMLLTDGLLPRIIPLFNFGGKPLYNLKQQLAKWDSVYEINQLVADGYTQLNGALTIIDAVAFVIICTHDYTTLEMHTNEIMAQDELGWTL